MNKPTQCIIIGGGASLIEGIDNGLWEKLKGHFVININHGIEFYHDHTFMTCVDNHLFEHKNKGGGKFINNIKQEPLIITRNHPEKYIFPNMIILKATDKFDRNLKDNKVYKGALSGIYSLTLAIHLLDEGEIFLLGYDFGAKGKKEGVDFTHWYQGQTKHKGIGKVNYYNTKNRPDNDFKPFLVEKKVKIYNVCLDSRIPHFTKISYSQFFRMLNKESFDQNELRKWIKEKLHGKYEQK